MALCRRISYLYALALLTVYALFLPLGGYERMMEGKYRAFLLLSLGYVLAMTALGAWRAVRWREPMCLAALAYLALTTLSAALSPYGTAVLLGGTRRDGLLTAALYAAVFLLLARHLRPDRRLLYAAAASAALALHAIPRHSGGQSFVNVGTLRAGSGRNVVPDHALMQVEVRGETTEINRFMMARTEEICRGAAAMQGCACSLTVMGTAEGQHSDLALIERIGAVIRRDLPGLTLSTEQNAKNWGSDDVSVMMNRVQAHGGQAAYMRAMADMAGAQHTVTFDFDEAVLGKSVAVFCAAAMALMGGDA